ncbi:thiamine pyrophosphate-binding protein [Tritonibacter mobilis]|uniref:thiamine pyrophosphate-binding protein n=1 Tax=Tritonibacter mobilis TaxID=379347 RepID=UPI0008069B17|nr:thiamine pyrophosphate-binding protein [Tritonibacter mobilis]GLP85512.1 thiamine pyrophosphate protein [Tritonibacter mobilis]SDW69130.1 acetolactate synthase, large subunit [Tritonibacter mobilis]
MSSDKAQPNAAPLRSGGRILADQLQILGADTIYCVPGESYLELLDGLHAHQETIKVVTCRHESGASNMADAYGKMTGKPGICAVTRGPGATNASNGVHTAFQDSTPMILLIGQVGREMVDREAFQEIDYRRMFGQMAKWVAQIDDAARIPEYMARAWKTALSGRPGPVVLALPEDMLTDEVAVADLRVTPHARTAPAAQDIETLQAMIARAERPMLMVGGPSWSESCAQKALAFAERLGLPVTTSFRSQDYVDNGHDNYVGPVGIAPIPNLRKRLREEVDLLITVGPRLGEMTTQGYELIDIPHPQMTFVHVHPGAEELGQVYQPDLAIQSDPELFFDAADAITVPDGPYVWSDWVQAQRADYLAFQTPTEVPGDVNMGHVVRHMSETLPDDTIYTNGAGNYTVWLHRFHQHRAYRTQLAPTSGSMGYGVPAAVAAKLEHPDRTVVAMAGDGCFMMTSQELATAVQHGADVIYVVVNNGMYGTIRMHQERHHPGKVMATKLVNPDFVAYAASFGITGERVLKTDDFPAALERARSAKGGYMIEIVVDPEALTPNQSLSAVRAEGESKGKS